MWWIIVLHKHHHEPECCRFISVSLLEYSIAKKTKNRLFFTCLVSWSITANTACVSNDNPYHFSPLQRSSSWSLLVLLVSRVRLVYIYNLHCFFFFSMSRILWYFVEDHHRASLAPGLQGVLRFVEKNVFWAYCFCKAQCWSRVKEFFEPSSLCSRHYYSSIFNHVRVTIVEE